MTISRPAPAIPQTDPRAGYLAQRTAIDAAIARVLDGGVYILGREVEVFEAAFADFIGVTHAIGVASGTDAIEMALRACGIGSGDLVFSVSHTAVATIAAIERAGATPVLVDVEPGTYTMAPRELLRVLQSPPAGRPAAILPVHIYGQPAELSALIEIARISGLRLHRGLRAEPWRTPSRQSGRSVWRYRLLQLLSDKEPRGARRRRHGRHERSRARGGATRNPGVWLARALCQCARRHQFASRPDPGGHPRRQAQVVGR